jgi:membrane protease YdiL (CAAX protease family)
MAGIGGLIAGYTYKYTNSIFTPLLSHFINNMIAAGHEVIDYAKTYAIIKETFKINF